jgi:hypothetical protein
MGGEDVRRTTATNKAGLARFSLIFNEEMDLQHMYEYYTKRLHNCRRAGGQMTKY